MISIRKRIRIDQFPWVSCCTFPKLGLMKVCQNIVQSSCAFWDRVNHWNYVAKLQVASPAAALIPVLFDSWQLCKNTDKSETGKEEKRGLTQLQLQLQPSRMQTAGQTQDRAATAESWSARTPPWLWMEATQGLKHTGGMLHRTFSWPTLHVHIHTHTHKSCQI